MTKQNQSDFLIHFGVKGMRWGVRRYQNEDGTLTDLARKRYGEGGSRSAGGRERDLNKLDKEITRAQAKADDLKAKADFNRTRLEYANTVKGLPKEYVKYGKQAKAIRDLDSVINSKDSRVKKALTDADRDKLQAQRDKMAAKSQQATFTEKRAQKYQKLADRGRSFTKKIVKETTNKGMSVYSSDKMRYINNGKNLLRGMLLDNLIGGTHIYYEKAVGNEYTVSNDGRGRTAHLKRYTKGQRINGYIGIY